jgi:hypothetical protein
MEVATIMKPRTVELEPGSLPPSGLGADGKLKIETEDERRQRLESARRRLREIAEIPDDPDDPPDEEWMRKIHVATLNVGHLARYCDARLWTTIT